MPSDDIARDDRPRPSRRRSPRSRSPSPSSQAPKAPPSQPLNINFEIAEGVPKNGNPTWRAEVNIPRSSPGHYVDRSDLKERVITVRGPSRVSKNDAEDDGDKMVEAAKKDGMNGCRKIQRELSSSKLVSSNDPQPERARPSRRWSRSRSRS
mmetsp:Transcript_13467/g.22176  ORF Transcript_13467/g.22176 Transcript_13467/m.22176 type:complete len:152 (+) Transcript_13467:70-525(+)